METAPPKNDGAVSANQWKERGWVVPAAHEMQQEHEQVEEIQIEPQSADHRDAAGSRFVTGNEVIGVLQILRVIGRQASEDQDAKPGNGELQR